MKTGPNAHGTAENDSRSVKHENETRRPRYRRKTCPGGQNMKKRHVAPGTAENESGRAKHKKRDPPLPVPPKTSP
jgi:hypothetical protein